MFTVAMVGSALGRSTMGDTTPGYGGGTTTFCRSCDRATEIRGALDAVGVSAVS